MAIINYNIDNVNNNIPVTSKNTNASNLGLYEARKFYKERTIPFVAGEYLQLRSLNEGNFKFKKIPFADLYRENSFFGIVDDELDIISPINDSSLFKTIGENEDEPVNVLDFVADAFNDMVQYIKKQNLKIDISPSSPYANIKAKKGYANVEKLYMANSLIASDRFRELCLADKQLDSKITNYQDFNREYIKFLKTNCSQIPVTKSRTISYYNIDVFTSGMAISISNDDPGDDVKKYLNYHLDPAFLCFSEACVRFGFKFDKNMPFVLLADIASPAMAPYYRKYGMNSVKDIFKKRFKKSYTEDLRMLKNNFFISYDNFIFENETYGENPNNLCQKDVRYTVLKKRTPVSVEEYNSAFNDRYWIKLYIYFKNIELSTNLTQQQFENIVRIANQYILVGKYLEGLKFISSRFNDLSGVNFFDSLLARDSVIQTDDKPVGSGFANEIFL